MARLADADLDRLRDGLTRTLDDWAPKRFPALRRDGELWRMGDIDGTPGQSLVINRRGPRAGSWHDFAAHAHGSVLDLWMAALRLSDFRAACEEAARYLADPAILKALERAPDRARDEAQADAARAAGRAKLVRRLFLEARPLAGSPAEAYLIGRGLAVSRLPRPPGALRFHPALRCPRWRETGEMRPGMIAIVAGPDGGQVAVHQTFLARGGDGRWRKAPELTKDEVKRSLGPVRGGFIPLARGASGRRWPDMPAGETVHVTEGIEDGLAVALAAPAARVIAGISLSNMANLPTPPSGGGFALCAQNDAKPAAIEGFERVRALLSARCPVIVLRPPAAFKDWAEWAQHLSEAQLAAAIATAEACA